MRDVKGKRSIKPQKLFLPHETHHFVDLFRYGLVALDVYRVTTNVNTGVHVLRSANCQTVKTKEEKEVLEHFAGVFTMMNMTTFKVVFSEMVEHLVERIQSNYALQIIPNSFLANSTTSATFAGILLTFLLQRMDTMGCNSEQSNLHLKLFKLVFGSVTLFAQENELMLKPHLHEIVNRSMSLANTAQDPCNYFLLLRALFRSIGGGSHEQLYQEFLPLLSNLLQGLNRLQSGQHKPFMKDLFVELCLTVPVRLSSLLPYLHMLMDPLVSALNGSQTLISQGLRTLELCVDNLQPDFLYEHIQPVRAELMQALWRTLHNPDDSVATVAFRVLGKFGGSNRKMLNTAQPLSYMESLAESPAVSAIFLDSESSIDVPIGQAIEGAVRLLKPQSSGQGVVPPVDVFYRQHAWNVIQAFLVSMLHLGDADLDVYQLLKQVSFQPLSEPHGRLKYLTYPQCSNKEARNAFETALSGVFIAACLKELRGEALGFMSNILKLITAIAVVQQCSAVTAKQPSQDMIDVHVMLDAIVKCVSSDEKELCKIGAMTLALIIDTATTIVGDKEKASELPLFEAAADRLCGCCYEQAWYAKNGGCLAIRFLMEKMPLKWVMNHQLAFVMALLFVLLDLSNEVSSGTVTLAKELTDKLLTLCNTPLGQDKVALSGVQEKSFHAVARHLVKEVISPNENVRKQSHHSLLLLANITGKSVTDIMDPHREILADMIPPKKHLLKHQPVSTQIALMEGNTFCTSLKPRLFSINLTVPEHKIFFQELVNLCDSDDVTLAKLPCYRSVPSLVPLKVSGLAALAACHYIPEIREKIFSVLYKAINSSVKELQVAGKEAMNKFMAEHTHADIELVHGALRPLLMMLGDYHNLSPDLLQKLTHMIELFPTSFNEKMCEALKGHLTRWIEVLITSTQAQRQGEEVQICLYILDMFHMLPASTFRLFEPLLQLALKGEKALGVELGSPFRAPLMKFALKFPQQTVEFFLSRLFDSTLNRVFNTFLRHKDGGPLRDVLAAGAPKIIQMTFGLQVPGTDDGIMLKKRELQYQGILLCHLLIEHKESWIKDMPAIVECLKKIWMSETYHAQCAKDTNPLSFWQESTMLVRCLLSHCKYHPEDIDTLFQLLRVYMTRHLSSYQFLTEFLDTEVAKGYSIESRRTLFFKFVEVFQNPEYPHELKAKILQYIIIPTFSSCFEEGKVDALLGGPPDPERDSDDNIISVFINKIINPDKPFGSSDPMCILLLQLSSLLVEHAAPHIHDSNNKKQGAKLRRLMTFAWPCLLPKQCVDPATKYHGHLLLAHIIAKFAIHKRIVLQVFHSLLKAHAMEARLIVRQALDILTPVVPIRMEDANATLVHWTKKIIVEEGHSVAQLIHMLQLLCRHHRVYYPVRQHLVQHMVSSIQRLGLTNTIEQRRLAVDLAEVIIKWEFQRLREMQEGEVEGIEQDGGLKDIPTPLSLGMKRSASDGSSEPSKRPKTQQQVADPNWTLEKQHADAIINFLVRLACQVNDGQTPGPGLPGSQGELLSKRCITLVKTALKPEIWQNQSVDIKIVWFAKLLETASEQPVSGAAASLANFANICTALDILTFLLTVLPRPAILSGFKTLQKGLTVCMTCGNTKVVRYVHGLLSKLMNMFPTEPASAAVCSKHDELDGLYTSVSKVIGDGLTAFEKASSPAPSSLQCPLMILKAVCNNDPCYIDRFWPAVLKVIQKLHKEHVNTPSTPSDTVVSELLQLCLEMMKSRVSIMQQETRKLFFNILTSLIEKSTDTKLLRSLTKIVEEWVTSKHEATGFPGPSLREKSLLLTRMMTCYEKRFPDDQELIAAFLDIVLFVYKNDSLNVTELTSKLEPAFQSGLRSSQVSVRAKFFEVFNASIPKKLFERLMYIVCSQNWEHCGGYFWIKHCIELVLAVVVADNPIKCCQGTPSSPVLGSLLPEELMEGMDSDRGDETSAGALEKLAGKLTQFLVESRSISVGQFTLSLAQLCNLEGSIAFSIWVKLFPKMWAVLSEKQKQVLGAELPSFVSSGAHVVQMDSHPSAVSAFLEGVVRSKPLPSIKPCLLKYLGRTHNYWHGAALLLEEKANSSGELSHRNKALPSYDGNYADDLLDPMKEEVLDSLSELYASMNEEDLWTGLWLQRCKFPETAIAVAYESQGIFEQSQLYYEKAIKRAREMHNIAAAPPTMILEYKLWEEHWCRCCQELGQWDVLTEFGRMQTGGAPFLVLENAWKVQDWSAMKEASTQAEPVCLDSYSAKLNLLRGYLALCYPDEQRLSVVEKLIEAASVQSIKHWRRLPQLISHAHVPLLQLSHQIMELQEALSIHSGLQSGGLNRPPFQTELKTIFKTWKNRLPNYSDDLSHWNDIFQWRQLHFKQLVKAFEGTAQGEQNTGQAMIPVHHIATSIIQHASVARKHKLFSVAMESLSKIHTIPSVPVVDCFQKIRQQVKCYLQKSGSMSSSEVAEGLDMVESTNLKYFGKEMVAEFMALKGAFLAQIGRLEDANKAFSSAVQLHDNLAKSWALWGDYLDQLFTKDRNLTLGVSVLTCYLHACRNQSEPKCRKYLARIIWMLTYDDEKSSLAEAVDKYYMGISPVYWLPWIPQLLTCLVRREGVHILNLLCSVGKAYPQAVYFPIRTLYLTLKMEQREKYKADQSSRGMLDRTLSAPCSADLVCESMDTRSAEALTPTPPQASQAKISTAVKGNPPSPAVQPLPPPLASVSSSQSLPQLPGTPQDPGSGGEGGPIRAPASLWRCSRIMHLLRDLHPTLLSALEGIVDQMIWFRESWYEELLRQLNEGLSLCQTIAFENREDFLNTQVPSEMIQYVTRLVNTFGVGQEQQGGLGTLSGLPAHEAVSKRASQDPAFQRLKTQFTTDFDFSNPGAKRLHNLITKLKKWIKILELKTKSLPKSFLLEERCRFLSNFSLATAEVEIPGEYLVPRQMPYYVKIARFMPRVELIQRHNSAVRRLCIQGDNGKIYPYLVLNDAHMVKCRREERVLQLISMMNLCLEKDKETSRRHLLFTIPRVVAVSPQMRLIEDNTSDVSLGEIFKQYLLQSGLDSDHHILQYYEKLSQAQARGEPLCVQVLQNIFTQIQSSGAPPTILKDWSERTFLTVTDLWTFRKQLTNHLSLCGLLEFILHLTRLDPDMCHIMRNSGTMTYCFYTFEINKQGELDANRPVPFRLTPCLQTLISPLGISGPLQMTMIATARCLVQPKFSLQSMLQAILRDEFIAWKKKQEEEENNATVGTVEVDNEEVIRLVTSAVIAITTRLQNLAEFEDAESKVTLLISAASNVENLCRMDPAWNPWL
ncbi:hypothetical protein EMCRGX_G014148 [Ephydatia muelleri]